MWWILAVAVLMGCRTMDVDVRPLGDARYPATDAASIACFHDEGEVGRPYEELAVVSYHARNPRGDSIRRRMHAEAAKLGADGIIWIRSCGLVYGPFGWTEQVDGWVTAIRRRER